MGTLIDFAGSETADWREDLQDILANGAFDTPNVLSVSLTLVSGDDYLLVNGIGLFASDGRTLDSGTITGFSIVDGTGGTLLQMTNLVLADYTDLQDMLDGADGLDPFSDDFLALIGPFFTDEPVSATGSDESDFIFGSGLIDTFDAGDGDDFISGNTGNDTIDGGDGVDTVSYAYDDDPTYGMLINLSDVMQQGDAGLGFQPIAAHTATDPFASDVDSLTHIENVEGTNYHDTIFGNAGDNVLLGLGGDDRLVGLGGMDVFVGGAGADTFTGSSATGAGNWDIVSYENDGGPDGVNISYGAAPGVLTVHDTRNNIDTATGIDQVIGTDHGDTFDGSVNDDWGMGLGGDDDFYARYGNDHFDGGDGTDTVYLTGDRDDYQVTIRTDGTIVLIDMREDTHGERSFYDNVEYFRFYDVMINADDLTSDIVHPGYFSTTLDLGGWELGWYTTGTQHLGWHYESGADVGWFSNPWGWTNGAWGWETAWYLHYGWEYGWYQSGPWAWGWHYDWGGWGYGITVGLTFGWWIGNVYGPPASGWYSGPSWDAGGWEYGWHGEGQSLYGWHSESGWDYGWFSSELGYESGWYYHVGWELGWYTAGWSVYGWFYDAGGWGSGWDIGGVPAGWSATQSGGWWTIGWTVGWSLDSGGWELGWYAAGGWALGWHTESGWDYGWYQTPLGWSWGWYYHVGTEYGWYGTGAQAWGMHFDFGGLGVGWDLGWSWGGALGSEYPPH